MRLHKTGHPIADTVSDKIGELIDGHYRICYGILRHRLFDGPGHWFEMDKGFWGANHYTGMYRLSYQGTQPKYHANGPKKPHGLNLKPMRYDGEISLICPPTNHVCDFFGVDYASWLTNATRQANGPYKIRTKSTDEKLSFENIKQVITFNSTVGVQALIEGVPVISDPHHSTIGSFVENYFLDDESRDELLSFMSAHQFKLDDKRTINCLIEHYLCTSVGIAEKQ